MTRRRRIQFQSADQVAADAERLLSGGYQSAGSWTLAKVCEHLSRTIEASLDAQRGFGGFKAPLQYRVVGRPVKHLILLTGWIPAGVKLPEAALPTAEDDALGVQRLTRAVDAMVQHQGAWSAHPFFGRMTDRQWRAYHLVHGAHHLSFLVPRDQPQRE
jgi:hypothetical protein